MSHIGAPFVLASGSPITPSERVVTVLGALRAFLLGTVAAGILAYALVAALAVTAQAGGRALEIAVGPLAFVSVTHSGAATVTTFGPGLVVLALAGGLANLAVAQLMRRRSGPPGDRVD